MNPVVPITNNLFAKLSECWQQVEYCQPVTQDGETKELKVRIVNGPVFPCDNCVFERI